MATGNEFDDIPPRLKNSIADYRCNDSRRESNFSQLKK